MAGVSVYRPTDPTKYQRSTTPTPAPTPTQPTSGYRPPASNSYAPPPSVQNIPTGPRPGDPGSPEYSAMLEQQQAQQRADRLAAEDAQRQRAIDEWNESQKTSQTGYGGNRLNPNTFGPTRSGQISQDTFEDHETIRLKHQLAEESADRRLKSLTSILGGESGNKEGADGYDPNAGKAARDAIFARAKDQQGQIARGALDSLRNVLSESGRLGGGYEDAAMTSVVNEAQGGLGEVTREQMIQELADVNRYEDRALTRRGQDMNYRQSLLSLINSTLY